MSFDAQQVEQQAAQYLSQVALKMLLQITLRKDPKMTFVKL